MDTKILLILTEDEFDFVYDLVMDVYQDWGDPPELVNKLEKLNLLREEEDGAEI